MLRPVCLLLLAATLSFAADHPALLPMPVEVTWGAGAFEAAKHTEKVEVKAASVSAPSGADEAYVLQVHADGVTIQANTSVGVLRARATLAQLTREGKIAETTIRDWPAFPVRGVMQDVGRNFQSLAALRRQVLVMERFKLNVFHWHLTDNPGWRVESTRNPGLNDPKSRSRVPQGQYSAEEIKAFVAYAAAHGVEVLAEMDLPGHSDYFAKGLGFDMQTPQGLKVVEGELEDWAKLFPSPLLHVGSDEVRIRLKEFVPSVLAKTKATGKTPVIWSPGAAVRDPDVVLQLWARAAVPKANRFIDSRYAYVNHMDPSEAPNQPSIQFTGMARTDGKALGAILCNWPDHAIADESYANFVSPTWPVAAGFAEAVWRGVKQDDKARYAKGPDAQAPDRAAYLDLERRIVAQRQPVVGLGEPFPFIAATHIPWTIVTAAPSENAPSDWTKGTKAWGGTVYLNHHWRELAGWLPNAKAPTVAWARTFVYSDVAREIGLSIGFDTPSSSDGHKPELAKVAGHWDAAGSALWLNGQAVEPPKWAYAGLSGKELADKPWVDHAWWMRPPQPVRLKAGWNEILIRTPSHLDGRPLRKWMFTAVPTVWDAQTRTLSEVDGLRFSTKPE